MNFAIVFLVLFSTILAIVLIILYVRKSSHVVGGGLIEPYTENPSSNNITNPVPQWWLKTSSKLRTVNNWCQEGECDLLGTGYDLSLIDVNKGNFFLGNKGAFFTPLRFLEDNGISTIWDPTEIGYNESSINQSYSDVIKKVSSDVTINASLAEGIVNLGGTLKFLNETKSKINSKTGETIISRVFGTVSLARDQPNRIGLFTNYPRLNRAPLIIFKELFLINPTWTDMNYQYYPSGKGRNTNDINNSATLHPYQLFMYKWGNHIIVSTGFGSKLNSWNFETAKEIVTNNDLILQTCITMKSLSPNPDNVKNVPDNCKFGSGYSQPTGATGNLKLPNFFDFGLCANYSKEDYKQVCSKNIQTHLQTIGGDPAEKILIGTSLEGVTPESLVKFIDAGTDHKLATPVKFIFEPIWDIILSLYDSIVAKETEVGHSGLSEYEKIAVSMPRKYWEQHCNNMRIAYIRTNTCPLQVMHAVDPKDDLVYMWLDSEPSTQNKDEVANYQCHTLGRDKCTKLKNELGKPACRKCVPRVGYGFTSVVYPQSCTLDKKTKKQVPKILEETDPVPTTAGGCINPNKWQPIDPKCICKDPAEDHKQIVWDSRGTFECS